MFLRDPDGHLIEISEASSRFLGTDSRRLLQKGKLHWAIRMSEDPPPIGSRIRFGGQPIPRAAGALTWLTNPLGNRTREQSSPPRKRRRRRRPRKSRRRRQRSRNRSASKAEAVGNRIPANPSGPHTEQAIVGRASALRTGDGAPPSSDAPFHRGRQGVRGARSLGDLSFANVLFVIKISRVEISHHASRQSPMTLRPKSQQRLW